MKDVIATNMAHQLADALRQSSAPANRIDKAYAADHSKPNIVAMKSDCCGSNNYENKRLAHN